MTEVVVGLASVALAGLLTWLTLRAEAIGRAKLEKEEAEHAARQSRTEAEIYSRPGRGLDDILRSMRDERDR